MAGETEINKRNNGKVDFALLMTIVTLLLFGLIMLFSASSPRALKDGNIYSIISKQIMIALIGVAGMVVTSRIDYHLIKKFATPIMIGVGILMFLVPLIGFVSHGARRQLSLGSISFQPSELAKFALIFYYAARFSDPKTSNISTDMKNLLRSLVPLGVYLVFCVLQSHLSAMVVLTAISVMIMIAAGLSMKIFWGVGAPVGIVGFLVLAFGESYRFDRFRALVNPEEYSRGIGWQILQSLYAVGSGGLFGLGLGQSRQKYMYLPEAHNDYIFAIVCEELGFIGAVAVIALFVFFVWRGMTIALNARDKFGMLTAFGITSLIGIQMLINIGVVLSILPSTGMQLPFFSAGGTSLIVMLSGVGVLLNISRTSKIKKL